MSSGIFTIQAELLADVHQFDHLREGAEVQRFVRPTALSGIVSELLHGYYVTSVQYGELMVDEGLMYDPLHPEVSGALVNFEVCDIDTDTQEISGAYNLLPDRNTRRFIMNAAAKHDQALDADEILLEGSIVPTILSNPRPLDRETEVIDATMVINTWRCTNSDIGINGFAPAHPDYFALTQPASYTNLVETLSIANMRALVARVDAMNMQQRLPLS